MRWAPVTAVLAAEPDGPLAQTFRSPLMVYLARTAYAAAGTDPAELCDRGTFPTKELVERHLFNSYLPAVYAEQGRPRTADRAARWLAFLASDLDRRAIRDFAW